MRLGRYTLKRRVGAGGMAEVWLAVAHGPAGFEKDVAIKRVLPHLATDREFIRLFIEEAKLVARLAHPNIVQVFDFGTASEDDATPSAPPDYFLAMEFVSGADLASVVKRLRDRGMRMPVPLALFIAAEVAKALDYAHGAMSRTGERLALVHRDISPHNVLLSFGGEVKVADFGIAAKSLTTDDKSVLRGKISYLSPEQARFEDLDGRSDVFSLGLVFYELITGRRLFVGTSSEEVLASISRFQSLSTADLAEIPTEVRAIVSASLAADRDERYPDAATMEAALAFALGSGGGVAARNAVAVLIQELFQKEREDALRIFDADRPSAEKSITVLGNWGAIEDVDATKTRIAIQNLEPELTPVSVSGPFDDEPDSNGGEPRRKARKKRRSRTLQSGGTIVVRDEPALAKPMPAADPNPSNTAVSSRRADDNPSKTAISVPPPIAPEDPSDTALAIDASPSNVPRAPDPEDPSRTAIAIDASPSNVPHAPDPEDPSRTAIAIDASPSSTRVSERVPAPPPPEPGRDDVTLHVRRTKLAIRAANEAFLPEAQRPRRRGALFPLALAILVAVIGALLGRNLSFFTRPVVLSAAAPSALAEPFSVEVPIETWSGPRPSILDQAYGPDLSVEVAPHPAATPVKKTATAAVAPTPVAGKKKTSTKKAVPAVAKGIGFLTVLADPWVEVWMDGARIADETPLRRHEAKPGTHKLRVVNKSIGFDKTTRVEIAAGEELRVFVDVASRRVDVGG